MIKAAEIVDALEQMGFSPNWVARFLEDHRITGIPQNPTCCPVAVYLRLKFGIRAHVRASEIQIEAHDSQNSFYVKPPRPVAWFILRFDRGRFPKLVRSGVMDEPNAPYPDDSFAGDLYAEHGELLDPAVTEVA